MGYTRAAFPLPKQSTPSNNENIFERAKVCAEKGIPAMIDTSKNHPSKPKNVASQHEHLALPTNDTITSLFVKENGVPTYQQPYIFTITEGNKIAIGTTHPNRKVHGDNYVYNPVGIHELIISTSIQNSNVSLEPLQGNNYESFAFGAAIVVSENSGKNLITCPVIQGAGLASFVMNSSNFTLEVGSGVGIRSFVSLEKTFNLDGLYNIELHDGTKWLMKVTPKNGCSLFFDNGLIRVSADSGSLVQFFPSGVAEEAGAEINNLFVETLCFGSYVSSFSLSETDKCGSMKFVYQFKRYPDNSGSITDATGLIFLLPHHNEILSQATIQSKTGIRLWSSVYGLMTGFVTGSVEFEFNEDSNTDNNMYNDIDKDNYNRNSMGNIDCNGKYNDKDISTGYSLISNNNNNHTDNYNHNFKESIAYYDVFKSGSILDSNMNIMIDNLDVIRESVMRDLVGANIAVESDLNSMYFAGKVFNKYAWLLFISHKILHDDVLSQELFDSIKSALNRFILNQQQLPLVYDACWKGLTSSGSSGEDFGNSYYNDHHFHYGYFVMTFAILADYGYNWYLQNRSYCDLLLRDHCNIDLSDSSFISYRNFNWFTGHSWANGIWPSLDGKDQESSSEDYNSVYAMYLYGSVTNNSEMTEIAKLQLKMMKQSNNHYFLYQRDNTTIFKELLPNKVAGIFFQNKIDYTTYFGKNIEYIHMIHFLPGTFISSYIRQKKFVEEEWEEKLKHLKLQNNGWNGLLKLNHSMIDPAAVGFFKDKSFDKTNLDGGQSQAFSLVLSLIWSQNT